MSVRRILFASCTLATLLSAGCHDRDEPQPLSPQPIENPDEAPPVVQDPNIPPGEQPAPPGPETETPPTVDPVTGFQFDTPGPWPVSNVRYGQADGILEQPIVGFTTDESQNRWVATNAALYLLKPGETSFKRYVAADGLHLQSNPVSYCDSRLGGGDKLCPILGGAADPGITEIVGGGSGEVFVGYKGIDEGTEEWDDPNRHSGKLDRIRLKADGTLQVDRIDLVATGHGGRYWHNRTVQRMLFDHRIHKHELYVGLNHGVSLIRPDNYRAPRPPDPSIPGDKGEYYPAVFNEYVADHLHARVCRIPPDFTPCTGGTSESSEGGQRMGDWRGLALTPAADGGHLWTAGKWTAGKILWHPNLGTQDLNGDGAVDNVHDEGWVNRAGAKAFSWAFGDPYPKADLNGSGFINEPVFKVPHEGDTVHLSAVTVAPNGNVWFASESRTSGDPDYGVAMWNYRNFRVFDPQSQLGLSEKKVRDLVALPDGRIVFAGPTSGLKLFDPDTNKTVALTGADYPIPDGQVQRLELDTMTNPPTLHVSTRTGATAIRLFPAK